MDIQRQAPKNYIPSILEAEACSARETSLASAQYPSFDSVGLSGTRTSASWLSLLLVSSMSSVTTRGFLISSDEATDRGTERERGSEDEVCDMGELWAYDDWLFG